MQQLNAFLIATTVSLLIVVAGLFHALNQHFPYAPRVNAEQQSNTALKREDRAKGAETKIIPANEKNGRQNAEQTDEEGSEFWPTFFGFKLKITDSLIALFNLGLFIFTGLLWNSTEKLFKAGERQLELVRSTAHIQSRDTQESIGLARNEFLSTHRPKIRVKHFVLAAELTESQPILINLICVNNGTSDALLQNVGMRFFVVRDGRDLPIETEIPALFGAENARLQTGLNYSFLKIDTKTILTPAQYSAVQANEAKLYCVGYVSYFDGASRLRITGFCRVLDFPSNSVARADNCRFRKFDDPDYEYED